MLLENFRPKAKLVTRVTGIEKPRYPVIDAHNHLWGDTWLKRPLADLLAVLDTAGVSHYVDLDGGWGEEILQAHLDYLQPQAQRFRVFGGVAWEKWVEMGEGFPEYTAQRLEVQKSWGAAGLKIWKNLGLHVRDHTGARVAVDDMRLDPIWRTAQALNLPVLIHVADPAAFFDPVNETNERWEELQHNRDWAFTSPPFPPFMQIIEELAGLVSRYPLLTFIGAHVGCCAEDLAWVGALMDRCPNFNVDISARVGELGRQPYSARRFFIQHADRIVFGLDGNADAESYRIMYRFLETDDEYFNYNQGDIPYQGRWQVCGLHLPDAVLEKVYNQNAHRLVFG